MKAAMTASNDAPVQTAPAIPPSPKQIDALILEYVAAQAYLQSGGAIDKLPGESAAEISVRAAECLEKQAAFRMTASAAAGEVKERLIATIKAHGLQHAKKSVRLAGLHNLATMTTGNRNEIKPGGVDNLKSYLDKSDIPNLSGRFFMEHISYSLVAGPSEVLKTLTLGKRIREKIESLLGLCFEIKTNAPSLKIETVESTAPGKKAAA